MGACELGLLKDGLWRWVGDQATVEAADLGWQTDLDYWTDLD
ncbi:MAG: hypothetical protein ACKO7W_11400 [Elainella sp.]